MKRVIKTVPAPAKALLDYLSIPESRGNYEVWSSFKHTNLPKPLTKSTIAEVLEYQRNWKSVGGISSAAGRYQIIRKTLQMLVSLLGLTGDELFDAPMQDRLGYQLLKIRGYDAWISENMSDTVFANQLAREWASLPVVTRQKNYKGVLISAGQSYYAGDGLNSHGVRASAFLQALKDAKGTPASADDAYVPVPKPSKVDTAIKVGTGVCVGTGGVIVAEPNIAQEANEAVSILYSVMPLIAQYGSIGLGVLALGAVAYFGYKHFKK